MYDTARRVTLVKQRVRENTRRKRRRGIYGLSAACMLLFAALMQAISTVVRPGQTAAWGVFGAMLLPSAGVFPYPLPDECDPSCGIVHTV